EILPDWHHWSQGPAALNTALMKSHSPQALWKDVCSVLLRPQALFGRCAAPFETPSRRFRFPGSNLSLSPYLAHFLQSSQKNYRERCASPATDRRIDEQEACQVTVLVEAQE